MTGDASSRRLLYAAGFVRAVGTGMVGVLLGLYLATAGLEQWAVGAVISVGLAGGALGALVATLFADRHGPRRLLIEVAVLGAAGTCLAAAATHPAVLGLGAFVGMLNGMGRDRGAAHIVEQALLPATTTDRDRTRVVATYTMLQDIGHALGSLLVGFPAIGGDVLSTQRALLGGHAVLLLVTAALYLALAAPGNPTGRALRVSPASRRILVRISALFGLDSLGSGFITTAMLSYFFFERFGVSPAAVGGLFFGARLLNAASHLAAAWLAARIGLVNTMVFTHIPSSLLLVTVGFAPTFPVAAALFLLREGLVEMDVPTRQSYVLAVVAPEERTVATGVTGLVRMAGWALGPAIAGPLMHGGLMLPLVVGATIKITYDVLLWVAFRRVVPPEEAVEAPR